MLTLAFDIQPVKARSDSTIGFYGMNYEIYRDSFVSYLKTLGYTVSAVDELNFTYADIVYIDYRQVYPLTEQDILDYVGNGGSLWVGGEAVGGAFLGITISTNSIWFVGSLSDPRVWITEHPVLQDVRSIAYPDGAWLEITGDIQEIMRIDGKTMSAVNSLKRGKILWLIDSDIFGDYFLDDEDNRILARNIAAWLTPRTLTASISPTLASILIGQSIIFTSTVSGGYTPHSYQWYLNGNPILGATSDTWAFTPTTSGICSVHLKVTDAKNNTAQSETARIAVAAVPVGGYSVPTQGHTKAEPIIPYIALVATLAAISTRLRPKTRRKRQNRPTLTF